MSHANVSSELHAFLGIEYVIVLGEGSSSKIDLSPNLNYFTVIIF